MYVGIYEAMSYHHLILFYMEVIVFYARNKNKLSITLNTACWGIS